MKKKLLIIFSLVTSLSFSQQVVKRITDTPTQTIVELFALRNGTSLPNTTGNFNFDIGTSDNKGNIIIYNPSFSNTYTKQQLPSGTALHSTEQIGNGTFPFDGNQTYTLNNTNFVANGGSGATLPLLIPQEDGNADSTQDSNSISDLMYSKFYLPKTLTNGNPIPTNLVAICISRSGTDLNTGGNSNPTKRLGFAFNGTTWVEQTNDPIGNTYDTLQEIDISGQLLKVNEFINNYRITIYPNPSKNFFAIYDQKNSVEDFKYKIIDLTGSNVKSGNSKFNEQISIESLTSGNYIIQIEIENGQKLTKKLIKY